MKKQNATPKLVFDRIFREILTDFSDDIKFNTTAKFIVRMEVKPIAMEFIDNRGYQQELNL